MAMLHLSVLICLARLGGGSGRVLLSEQVKSQKLQVLLLLYRCWRLKLLTQKGHRVKRVQATIPTVESWLTEDCRMNEGVR